MKRTNISAAEVLRYALIKQNWQLVKISLFFINEMMEETFYFGKITV
ncbi:hypothetical protein [Candidatus Enterococcus leclercqii]|nr:hypothetical protein [Enterococcus sp. CU9D]